VGPTVNEHPSHRGQGGFTLPYVLILIVGGVTITLAALAFAFAGSTAGTTYQKRDVRLARERDALEYLVASIRPDLNRGRAGDTQTATVAGVTASCTGQTGSGQTSGVGRTDRVIKCTTASTTATYRIFDRSGDRPGIVVETLASTTGG